MNELKKYELVSLGDTTELLPKFKDCRTDDTRVAKIQILEAEIAELKKQLAAKNLYAELGRLFYNQKWVEITDYDNWEEMYKIVDQIKELEAKDVD